MPDIPNVPGVPPLASYATSGISLLISDLAAILLGSLEAQWGIFQNGFPVIVADNTVSFEFKQDLPVSDYPVEEGGFQSYDKVQLPGDVRMRFSTGGSVDARQAFIASIDAVMNTTDLYDVVTPEKVYLDYNFTHQDFRRSSSNGVGLISIDLWLTEIRQTSTASFSNTQQPGEAGQQSLGTVQPQAAPATLKLGLSNTDPNRPQIQ